MSSNAAQYSAKRRLVIFLHKCEHDSAKLLFQAVRNEEDSAPDDKNKEELMEPNHSVVEQVKKLKKRE